MLKITKGQSEAVNPRTDNTMATGRKKQKRKVNQWPITHYTEN
jgi:hypothetical protein